MRGITLFFLFVSFTSLYSQPITLRDTTNQYDYIIITVPEFVNACEPFRQHKETVREFRTLILDTTQIFAEFDSSAAPQDNIRNFISYAGTFWKEPRPKFFLIAGDVEAVPNFLILFPPGSYFHSDFYYGISIYDEDSTTTEFYIGRIPVKDVNELQNYFNKVINYETDDALHDWLNNNLFICEDDIQFGFCDAATFLADSVLPDYMRSYFFSDDSNSIYYGNKDSIVNFINNKGCSAIWFIGHNRDTFVIRSDYFSLSDLASLENSDMPFITIYVGNQSSILDTNTNMTAEMLKMENAGSLGGFVDVGLYYWGIGSEMNRKWAERLFDPLIQSLGEVFNLDNLIPLGGVYWYMRQVANLWADPSLKLKYDTTVDVEKIANEIPNSFILYQNYPNPFNPKTSIQYAMSSRQFVTLKVYDILGNEVAVLVNEEKPAGSYELEFNAEGLPSGVYFYHIRAGGFVETKKMLLLK